MTVSGLVEFLLSRLDAEQAMIGAANWSGNPEGEAAKFAHRYAANIAARREVVELHYPHPEFDALACVLCQWDVDCNSPMHDHQFYDGKRTEWPCETLLALAQPYADDPGFDPGWLT